MSDTLGKKHLFTIYLFNFFP